MGGRRNLGEMRTSRGGVLWPRERQQVSIAMGLQTNLPKQPISSVRFSRIFLLVTFPQFTTQAQISFSFVLSHLHVHHPAKGYVSSQAYWLLQVSPFYEGLHVHT